MVLLSHHCSFLIFQNYGLQKFGKFNVSHCVTGNIVGYNWAKRISVYQLTNWTWEGIEEMKGVRIITIPA